MTVEVFPVPLGFDTCYVLRGEGVIAVDGGQPHKGATFLRGLSGAGIPPEDVKLIVLTHGHWDHVGSAGEIKSATGGKLALHEREIPWLEESRTPLPPGVTTWGKIFIRIHHVFLPFIKVPPAKVDLPLGSQGMPLAVYGIPGRVVYTPGHTMGSVSVVLDDGRAFVGDLAMNKFPLRLTPGLPVIAEDIDAVVRSWRMLLDQGVTTVYPAHGKPFSADVMRRAIGG